MKAIFLGTGTSQGIPVIGCSCDTCMSADPRDKRLRCALYVEYGGSSIVIDIGPDFRMQMLNNQLDKVDAAFITHEHSDHTAGLDDIRPLNFMTRSALKIFTLPRVAEDLRSRFAYIFKENPYPGSPKIDLIEVEHEFSFKEIQVDVIHYLHGKLPMIGFRIGNLAYLTDFYEIDSMEEEKLKSLDVLIVSALRREPHHSHLTLDEAIGFAQKINAKKTYLIHMSHHLGPVSTWDKELPEDVYVAYDQLEITFT